MSKINTKEVSLYRSEEDKKAYQSVKPSAYRTIEDVLNSWVKNPIDEEYINMCSDVNETYTKFRNNLISEEEYKEKKSQLPLIVRFGGKFTGNTNESLSIASNILFVDIDVKDNPDLDTPVNFIKYFDNLKKIKWVYAVWKSCSGKGFRILVKLKDRKFDVAKQIEYYSQAYHNITSEINTNFKLVCDKQCSNISRLVYLNCDKNIYINDKVSDYDFSFKYKIESKATVKKVTKSSVNTSNEGIVKHIIEQCKEKNINLCDGYDNWFKVACSLKTEFGDAGFDSFDKLSSFDKGYKGSKDCKKQYDVIKNRSGKKWNLGTLIIHCKKFAITFDGFDSKVQQLCLQSELFNNYDFYKSEIDHLYYYKKSDSDTYQRFSLDEDFNTIKQELQSKLGAYIRGEYLRELIINNNTPIVNPLKVYFEELVWDGKDRISELFDSLKTDDHKSFKFFFKKWYLNMINVIYDNEDVNDVCLVLQGAQSDGKTWFFRNILPKAIKKYVDVVEDFNPTDKDHKHKLCSKMLIVLDEMSSYSKADLSVLKSTISKSEYDLRLAYRSDSSDFRRYCSFAGTVNDTNFLRDWTGDRRYAVFSLTEPINGPLFNSIDKEQLLAQFMDNYKKKVNFKFTKADRDFLIVRNREHYTVENEEQIILSEHLVYDEHIEMSLTDIKRSLKGIGIELKCSNQTFGNIMNKLNYIKKRKTINGNKITVYSVVVVSNREENTFFDDKFNVVDSRKGKLVNSMDELINAEDDDFFNVEVKPVTVSSKPSKIVNSREEQLRSNFNFNKLKK